MLRLLAFVLPLGVDSFAVAAALGAAGLTTARQRLRISLIFVLFETGMPLLGVAAGAGVAAVIGGPAEYVAAAAVLALGVYLLRSGDEDETGKAVRITGSHGLAVIALGISISMDELAIGFGLGLVKLAMVPVIVAIAVQTVVVSQLGLALGGKVSGRFTARAGQVAAVALILLGTYLIVDRLAVR